MATFKCINSSKSICLRYRMGWQWSDWATYAPQSKQVRRRVFAFEEDVGHENKMAKEKIFIYFAHTKSYQNLQT